ncbi:hypothetical protein NDU88_001218 [Pleurodeles waltl]|uniref:Reverse transcriptase domain-containing protein n=1 Tax=Pleurodeles waltl TaxID=8319 RepID=A0AAV7NAA4_PLEWA|nr:hypothetical protein NDU88_001218 [Pleurodeles waltl]
MPHPREVLAPQPDRGEHVSPQESHPPTPPTPPRRTKISLPEQTRQQRPQQQGTFWHRQRALQPRCRKQLHPSLTGPLRLPRSLLPPQNRRHIQQLHHYQHEPTPRTRHRHHHHPHLEPNHHRGNHPRHELDPLWISIRPLPAPHLQQSRQHHRTPRDVNNTSLTSATFPESWKHTELNALLKKPTADPTELKNFRPISLLPFPAKVIEKIVNAQLTTALETNDSLDPTQFGFRANHSTETALIAATDDIRSLTDKGETVALILLDLSAAFDTVCHRTLIHRLSNAGIRGKALEWIISFLSGRTQRVRLPPFRSTATEIICGVPQGSSLSPTLFNIYMTPLANIARKHGLDLISYADDTQLILSLTNNPTSARTRLHEGMKEVANWMTNSRLKLNTEKTEVLILGPTPTAWDDSWWPPALGSTPQPTDHARNLGFILDSSLSMSRQVNSVTSACFNTLRMLRKIFRWIPTDTRKTVTHALVTSRLDYGNTLYAGITIKLQRKLQRIQNAAA